MIIVTLGFLLQTLYPRCGGQSHSSFITDFTDSMVSRPGIYTENGVQYNPMREKSPSYLGKIFRGERPIPKKDANLLLARLQKHRIEKFVNENCFDDTRTNLANVFSELGFPSVNRDNVAELCADIVEEILLNGVYKKQM